jgi:hypothetical protein
MGNGHPLFGTDLLLTLPALLTFIKRTPGYPGI